MTEIVTPVSTVRLATRADADSIMQCLRMMHEENGLFSLAEDRVRGIIAQALNPPPGIAFPPVIGVIGDAGDVEATICLSLTQFFYTDQWHMTDLWCFIRPDSRKKNHIKALVEFAKFCADKTDVPFFTGVISNKRTEAKIRIFSRHFGAPLGSAFLYQPHHQQVA